MSFLYPTKPNRGILGTGERGSKQGEFFHPSSVCYDKWNHCTLVCELGNNRIQCFDSNTLQFHSFIGTRGVSFGCFCFPMGLCIQPFTHNLLVCDSGNQRVQVFTSDTDTFSFLYQIGYRSSSNGDEIKQFDSPRGICCDEKGHIIISEPSNHAIYELNEYGRLLHVFGSKGSLINQFNFPQEVCYDENHHQLLVADYNNQRVSIWSHDSSSKFQCISHIQLNDNCFSICIDPLRNHQILIGTNHNVLVYDPRNITEPVQTLGEFNMVSSLCINKHDGTLIVAEFLNHQIQLF